MLLWPPKNTCRRHKGLPFFLLVMRCNICLASSLPVECFCARWVTPEDCQVNCDFWCVRCHENTRDWPRDILRRRGKNPLVLCCSGLFSGVNQRCYLNVCSKIDKNYINGDKCSGWCSSHMNLYQNQSRPGEWNFLREDSTGIREVYEFNLICPFYLML